MTNSAKIKVACVGTGYFSRFHYDAWKRIEGVDLVASVNRDIRSAEATGLNAYNDLSKMLETEKPDLVDIITPPLTHFEYIKIIAKSGVKAIICQKPFCNNLEEARQATEICKAAGIKIVVHENFRFQPWYRVVKKAIDVGMIGELHQITLRMRTGDGQGPNAYMDRQPYFQKMERLLIHETGVHWVDTFCYLMDENPKSVYADIRKLNPVIAGEDAGYFLMEFEGGKRALFDGNRLLDHAAENCRVTLGESLIEGTKGTLEVSGRGEVTFREFGSEEKKKIFHAENWVGFGGDCVLALQSHVISALNGDSDLENQAADYLRVLEIEAAIYSSAETGQKVNL